MTKEQEKRVGDIVEKFRERVIENVEQFNKVEKREDSGKYMFDEFEDLCRNLQDTAEDEICKYYNALVNDLPEKEMVSKKKLN